MDIDLFIFKGMDSYFKQIFGQDLQDYFFLSQFPEETAKT
jgi:hypothetical protein